MKKRKTAWIIAFISAISMAILTGCNTNVIENNQHPTNTKNVCVIEEKQNTPHDVLEQNYRMAMSKKYDLVYTGKSIIAYQSGKAINEVEIGKATYCGFSNRGNHYFLLENSVIKVTYSYNEFKVENIADDVDEIIDTNFRYSENEKSALLVVTLDGKLKVWAYDSEWIELKTSEKK